MEFNDIGIDSQLDWPRIRKLLKIGFFGALLNFIGDFILAYGPKAQEVTGLLKVLPHYINTNDSIIFTAALLGMMGMVLDGLSFFGIYRLIASKSLNLAHHYRSGIFGYLMFGPCGFHVGICGAIYLYKYSEISVVEGYIRYFIMPALILFWIFFLILVRTQIKAFLSSNTPYPKWCAIFNPLSGVMLYIVLSFMDNCPVVNALSCAWLGIGCMFTFAGLLINIPKEINK